MLLTFQTLFLNKNIVKVFDYKTEFAIFSFVSLAHPVRKELEAIAF